MRMKEEGGGCEREKGKMWGAAEQTAPLELSLSFPGLGRRLRGVRREKKLQGKTQSRSCPSVFASREDGVKALQEAWSPSCGAGGTPVRASTAASSTLFTRAPFSRAQTVKWGRLHSTKRRAPQALAQGEAFARSMIIVDAWESSRAAWRPGSHAQSVTFHGIAV